MTAREPMVVVLPGGRRVDVQVGRHVVRTDQPVKGGGDDSAPSPFDLFLASIGACAGIFVQGFCAARNLPFEGITILERPHFGEAGALEAVDLELRLPKDFPARYRDAVVKVAEQCSVKKAIAAQPRFTVTASQVANEDEVLPVDALLDRGVKTDLAQPLVETGVGAGAERREPPPLAK
jgi:ribosomal protein S12 methylthiotransferase accessory factor